MVISTLYGKRNSFYKSKTSYKNIYTDIGLMLTKYGNWMQTKLYGQRNTQRHNSATKYGGCGSDGQRKVEKDEFEHLLD